MGFTRLMELAAFAFEIAGVAIFVIGSLAAAWRFVGIARTGAVSSGYEVVRTYIGRTILLGLEVLIVADIIKTITVDQTLESALTLGLIVLVRTFLSFSLQIELEGMLPWRRAQVEAAREAARTEP
jgi:uncharacterized membrane protein